MTQGLGDGPIEERYVEQMKALSRGLDELFNGESLGEARQTGFVLLVFPFGDEAGRCNYISNARGEDVLTMMRGQVKRLEERYS